MLEQQIIKNAKLELLARILELTMQPSGDYIQISKTQWELLRKEIVDAED